MSKAGLPGASSAIRRRDEERQRVRVSTDEEMKNPPGTTFLMALANLTRRWRHKGPSNDVALSTILSSIGEGLIVYDRDFRFRTWNTFMERLTGLTSPEVLGRSLLDVFPELEDTDVIDFLSRALTGETVKQADARFRIPFTGKDGWVSVRYDPYRSASGEIVGVVAVLRDVSEQKKVERALAASERILSIHNRVAEVFLTVPDVDMYERVLSIILDALDSKHGVFGYINFEGSLVCPSMTSEIFDQCDMSTKTVVFPAEAWGGIWGESLTTKKSILSNASGVVPDGHIGIDRCIFVPITDKEEVIGLLAVANRATDYTEDDRDLMESIARRIGPILHARLDRAREERERLRAEDEVRASERRYRAVVERQTELVERFTEDGTVTFANDAMCRFFGVARRDLIGTKFHPLMTDDDREATERHLASLSPENPIGVNEIPCVAPDGSRRWVSWTNQAMFDGDGKIVEYQAVGRDVTEQVDAAEDLRRVLAEKDALLKEVHHRVKNNMAVISSMVSLQADEPTTRDATDALARVRGRIRAMALVHEQIYHTGDFRKVDLGEYSKSLINAHFQTHSDRAGQIDLQTRIADLGVSLDLAIPCGLILNELIANSFEHAFPGDRPGEIVVVFERCGDGCVELRVTDNGVGIDEGVEVAQLGGLGLQLVDLLAKQLDGHLEMSFEDGADIRVKFALDPV